MPVHCSASETTWVGCRLPPLILAYHAVGSVSLRHDPHRLFTSPAALRRHVRWLRSRGYRFTTVGELAGRVANGSGDGSAALSFDDGFADQLGSVLGALEVPATVFAVTAWLGGRHPHAPHARIVTAAELRALHTAGVEVGGHTATHRDLTTLAFEEARNELEQCRRELEAIVDGPVATAAYPWGSATPETQAACAAAGYRAAVLAGGAGSWEDAYALPRQRMLNGSWIIALRLKRDDRYEDLIARPLPLRARNALLRLRGWRRPA
jgi:peptidoglycan/xylan/chitin deacetylase (PgdA/CDA1 family)